MIPLKYDGILSGEASSDSTRRGRRQEEDRRQADLSKFGRITIWQNHHFGVLEKAGEVAGAQESWK